MKIAAMIYPMAIKDIRPSSSDGLIVLIYSKLNMI